MEDKKDEKPVEVEKDEKAAEFKTEEKPVEDPKPTESESSEPKKEESK